MTNRIDVLDHGFVRLVSYMQPVPQDGVTPFGDDRREIPDWTGDLEIVRNARVSYDADWRTGTDEGSDDRLVRRLHARGHTSPFEAMVFTFEVQAPIFVFRQWHRHRTWSYNELSARYGELPALYYVPKPEHVGKQDPKEKQARTIVDALQESEQATRQAVEDRVGTFPQVLGTHSGLSFDLYRWALGTGVPRELARALLPVNTYSRMFATVNLHNLFHFLRLRMDSHAQYEIQVYAKAILELIRPVCPLAVEAFEKSLTKPLTKEEIDAVISVLSLDIEINADDELDKDDREHYDLLESALEKLR